MSLVIGNVKVTKRVDFQYSFIQRNSHKLIVFLTGAGERGISSQQAELIAKNLFLRYSCNIIIPLCGRDDIWRPDAVVSCITDFKQRGNIIDKVCLLGYSMGARGVWDTAIAYPKKWSAIVPVAGFSCYLAAKSIAHIPCWIFHGNMDNVVPPIESMKMYSAMKEHGGNPKLSLLDGFEHDIDLQTLFNLDGVYNWIMKS